jgi:hypothetical protein
MDMHPVECNKFRIDCLSIWFAHYKPKYQAEYINDKRYGRVDVKGIDKQAE